MALDPNIETQEILLKFAADTKEALKKIKEIGGAQKDFGDKAEKSSFAFVEAYAKVTAAVAATAGAYKIAQAGLEEYTKVERLQRAGSKFSLDELRQASKGLISDTQLLELAAKASGSQFKITQTQLNNAASAMIALRNQGHEMSKVFDGVLKSTVENSGEALVEFGIGVADTNGKLQATTNVSAALASQAAKLQTQVGLTGDEFARAGTEWSNAVSGLKVEVGELVAQMAPLVSIGAKLVSLTSSAFRLFDMGSPDYAAAAIRAGGSVPYLQQQLDYAADGVFQRGRDSAALGNTGAAVSASINQFLNGFAAELRGDISGTAGNIQAQANGLLRRVSAEAAIATNGLTGALTAFTREAKKSAGQFELGTEIAPSRGSAGLTAEALRRASLGFGELEFQQTGNVIPFEDRSGLAPFGANLSIPGQAQSSGIGALGTAGFGSQAQLAGEFAIPGGQLNAPGDRTGWTPEMWDQHTRGILSASQAFGTFQQIGTQAFTALITSNESFGESIKKIFGQTLLGLSAEMFSRSLLYGGLGIVSAITGNPQAGGYFAAAAALGAGAVTTGLLAREFGAGGAGGARVGAGPAVSGLGGAAAGASQAPQGDRIFVVGAEWAQQSPRQRRAELYSTMRAARASEFGNAVEFG